jgi:hypothetical protein
MNLATGEQLEMYRGVVKHALRLGLLLVAFVFALSACGGGGGAGGGAEVEAEQAKTRTLPDYGDLRPGKYTTDEFEPAFSFEVVGGGWVVGGYEERGALDMKLGAEGPLLSFVNEQRVFDPSRPRDLVGVSAPEDLAAWLQRHPYLETGEPRPATVGGVKGVRFDATVADVPASECGETCLGLLEVSPDIDWVVFEEERVRFIVLEDVGGERVTIAAEAPAADFEEFLPKAQQVIDTVEWEGT